MWGMSSARAMVDTLDRAGLRVTEPRRVVAELVAMRSGHFTAADLEREASRRRLSIGRATIFRALELFTQLGVVERIDLPTGEHAYVGCEPSHHHHVVCVRCGASQDVDACGLPDVAGEAARRTGFRIEGHRLELYGVCPACQAAATEEASR